MQRRDFLIGAAATATAASGVQATTRVDDIPIIDTHFHLFDNKRPQGAPYTGSQDYKGGVSLPSMYRAAFAKLGVVGAIELEASPWIEDNLWVLEQLATDPLCVGTVGDLEPEKPEFAEYLDRYRRNPLFLGIRCGNIWGRDVSKQVQNPVFIAGLKRLAATGLVMDSANPDVALLQTMVKINDQVPDLTIVLDHLPSFDPKPEEMAAWDAVLKQIHGRPKIVAKLSEIQHRKETDTAWPATRSGWTCSWTCSARTGWCSAATGRKASAPPHRRRSWGLARPISPPAAGKKPRSISGRIRFGSINGKSAPPISIAVRALAGLLAAALAAGGAFYARAQEAGDFTAAQAQFDTTCAACHGEGATGGDRAPR